MTDDILRERDERGHHIVPYPVQAQAGAPALREALKELIAWVKDSDCRYGDFCIAMEVEQRLQALTALPPAAAPAKERP